ncbi:TRAP-type C4-dicarboxylate transport system permease small subunit [Sphaerotilus hippei]|uniref:TRAP transporter small permease protein n=1 Tax=Sphaerotilus hippei TaxID=744406 RepID=A0A318H1G7_9BURK|nr:TRAP transporter small permease [Sphaerotilus hippei]PXW94380.1 TRAP-type C4-dicarboxylate transport system permease small subunit [Sphaerotilus hippei]
MKLLERGIVLTCQTVMWISTTVIFLILSVNTVLRYSTGSSLQWGAELPELLFPWLVMAGVVLGAAHGSHITTTFLVETLPASVRRVIALIVWLTVAALYGTLARATWNMLEIVADEKSPILQVPGSVTYGCVMGGMVMLSLLALVSAWRVWCDGPAGSTDGHAQNPPIDTARDAVHLA